MSEGVSAVTPVKSTSKENDELLFQLNSTMRIERIRQEASKHTLENFITIAKRNLREKKKRMINDAERTDLKNAIAILQSNGSESSSRRLKAVERKYDFEDVEIEHDEYYDFLNDINVKVMVKDKPTRFQRQREIEYRQATVAAQSTLIARKNETPKTDDESVDRFQPSESNNDNYISDDDENDSNSSISSNCGAVDDDFIDDDDDSVASSHKNSRAWLRLNAYFACTSRGKKCRIKRRINNNITKNRTTSNNNSDPSILRKLLPSNVKNENNAAVMTKESLCEKENANLSCKMKWKRCQRHKLYKRNIEFPVKHPVYKVVYARWAGYSGFERDVCGGMYATGFNNPLISRSASAIGGHPSSPGVGLLRMLKNVEPVDELLPKHLHRDGGGTARFYSPSQFHHASQPHFGMPQLQGGFRAPYGPPFMGGAIQPHHSQYQSHHHQVIVGGGGSNMMTGGFYPNSQQQSQQSHQMMVGRVPISSVAQSSHHQHPMDHHVTHRVGGDSSTGVGGVGGAAAIRQMRLSNGAENASSAINMSNAFSDLEAIAEMASDETDCVNDGSGRPGSAATTVTTSPSVNASRPQQQQSTPQQLSPMEQHRSRSPNIARFRLMQQQHQQQSQQSVGAEVFDFMPDDCTASGSPGATKPSNNSSFDDTSVAGNVSGRRGSSGCGRATKSSSIDVDSVPGTPTQPRRQRKPRKTSNAAASLPAQQQQQQQQPPIGYGLAAQQQIGFPSNVPHTASVAAAAAAAAAAAEETRRMYEMEMVVDSSDDDEETDPPPPHRLLAQQQQAAVVEAAATDVSNGNGQQPAALTAQQQRLQRNAAAVAEQQQRKMSSVTAAGSKPLTGTATLGNDSNKSSSSATAKPSDGSPLSESGTLKKGGAPPLSQTQSSSQQQKQLVAKREMAIDAESDGNGGDGGVTSSNKSVSSPKIDASTSSLQLKQMSTTASMSAKFTTAIAQSTLSRQRDAAKLSSASLHSHRDATIASASKEVLKRKTSVSSASDAAKGAIKSDGGDLKFVLKLHKGTTSSSAGSGSKSHHSSASPASSSSSGGGGGNLTQTTAATSANATMSGVVESVVRLSSHAAPPSKSKSTLRHHHSRMMYVDAQPQHRLGGSATAPSASIGSSRKRAAASEEGSASSSRNSKKRIRDAGGAAVLVGSKSTTTKRGSISSASGSSMSATTANTTAGASSTMLSGGNAASGGSGAPSDPATFISTPLDSVVTALPSAPFFQSSSLRKFKIPKVVDADTTTNSGNTVAAAAPTNKPENNTASPSYGSQSGAGASTITGSGIAASSGPPSRGGGPDSGGGGSSALSHRRPNKSILRNPSASSSSAYGVSDRDRGRMGGAPPYRSGGGGGSGLSKSRKPPLMPGHPRVPQLLLPGSSRPPLPPPGSGGLTSRGGLPVWQSNDAPSYARGGSGGVPAPVDWAPAFSHHQQQLQSGGYGGLSNTFNPLPPYNSADTLSTRTPLVPSNNVKDYGGGGSVITDSNSGSARNSGGDVPTTTEEPLSPVEGLLIDEDE